MKRTCLVSALIALVVCSVSAKSKSASTTEGTIVSEKSVDCGSQRKGHKKTLNLLCQEYVIRTSVTEYRIRQATDSAKELLPVHSTVNFLFDKDKVKFT